MLEIKKASKPEEFEALKAIRGEGYRQIIQQGALLSDAARGVIMDEKVWTAETDKRYVHILAFSDNIACGCVSLFFPGEDGKLHSESIWNLEDVKKGCMAEGLKLMVPMKFIVMGVGNALMFTAYEVFRLKGVDNMIINVIKNNQYTNRLYKKFGFEVVKEGVILDTHVDIMCLNIPKKESNSRYSRYHRYMRSQKKLMTDIDDIHTEIL